MEDPPELGGLRLGGRYELQELIAAGGMADVWRGRDLVLDRPIAVKILRDELARDEEVLERFRLEAVAAARLSHPAVVRVFDTGVDGGQAYIVMELSDGPTLSRVLEETGPLPPDEAARIVAGALRGLAHAHGSGVVHRDVKPSNILVGDGRFVKVTDFGIAKAAFAGGDLTTTGSLLGTARYLAPEQVAGGDVDARADLYAAGVVLYELLTGRAPFEGETHLATATMRLTRDPVPPGALRSGIPRDLEQVVLRALARDPDRRYQSAEEMHAALERTAPVATPHRRPVPGRPSRREGPPPVFRSWLLVPIALAIVAAVVVGGFAIFDEFRAGPPEAGEQDGLRPAAIEGAFDHDPEGDGSESSTSVGLAIDGDQSTGWQTEGYNQPDLGGLKSGVGIAFDLGERRTISQIRLTTDLAGWQFQIRGSDDEEAFSGPIPSTGGVTTFRATPRTTVTIEPTERRFFLIWITLLTESPDRFRAQVTGVELLGPR
ncbi:MAG: protein kinase domain-containing protein [Actinomycetota bacterium]